MLLIFDILNGLILAFLFVKAILIYPKLPNKIPVHFDITLTPDAWGTRKMIFFLPTVALVLFVIFYLTSSTPENTNFIVPITPENQEWQFWLSELTSKVLLLDILLLFYVLMKMMIVEHRKKYKPYAVGLFIMVFVILMVHGIVSYLYR